MRFWQRIFISTLLIFIALFDLSIFILVSYAYNYNLRREKENAIREHSVILSSVFNNIENVKKLFPNVTNEKERLEAIVQPLSDYYADQGVYLALYYKEEAIHSKISNIDEDILQFQRDDMKNVKTQTFESIKYVFVASKIPTYDYLTFVYSRDISQLDEFRMEIIRIFIIVSIGLCIVLGIAVFIILKRLTRPLNSLNAITSEIANGAYDKRVAIKRNDELGELGVTFNRMAESIEDKVERLTKSAEDKQQLIDNLSHEIKTPITSILGYGEYLQNAISDEEQRVTAAGHLYESAKRLRNLSAKMLDLTYLHSGNVEFEKVDVSLLFDSLENLMQPELNKRKLKLEIHTDVKWIQGDDTLLLSMLTNLVGNAARASRENQTITVRAYGNDNPVMEVRDEGYGMEEEEIKKITEPFYRIDKSRARAYGGVGLGLSIVAGIADLHGARLDIDSKLGVGTRVRVIFCANAKRTAQVRT